MRYGTVGLGRRAALRRLVSVKRFEGRCSICLFCVWQRQSVLPHEEQSKSNSWVKLMGCERTATNVKLTIILESKTNKIEKVAVDMPSG